MLADKLIIPKESLLSVAFKYENLNPIPVFCKPFLVIDQFGNLLSCVCDFCHLNSANQPEKFSLH